ncbi:MAG: hypothetical protein AB1637_07445 [Elusimicrobiota bacterium]
MKKIKRFKIPLYHYDIYRKAKKLKYEVDNSHFRGQEGLKEFVSVLYSSIEPYAVFDTIEPDSPLWMRLNLENKQVAATLGFVSFFGPFQEKISSISDPLEKNCAELAAHCILSSAVSLVSDLAQEEAKNEGLNLSKPYYAHIWQKENFTTCCDSQYILDFEPEMVKELLLRLEAQKHGVEISDKISPYHTCVFAVPWLSPKKR